ncbi:hypothetical protein KMZ32_01850 [Phycicoccus sp. MAQZ13P-2]|uniref:hypothetical protein n=1 Tax=Phycicoccus mangrovi TaxID=2840470 RepID=UPI001BFFF7A3|nr:hypothetical protein [Phycicoccus mangrovi]MBT9254436.1 hypothetical protein [Phycicoccus mangrovi]MBT9272814.1 hypothetical protein [Phycicoccus mangrovi]
MTVTYGNFKLELGTWRWVGGTGRDLDWDEIPPLPQGQSPVTLLTSGGGSEFPAWSHVRLPQQSELAVTPGEGSTPAPAHLIRFD